MKNGMVKKWQQEREVAIRGWRLHQDVDHAFKLLSTLQFTSLQTINNSRVHNETFSPVSYYAPAKFSSAEIYSVTIQNARCKIYFALT